ncbi:CRISPR-associated helicase Cas3' [Chitinophaga sp. G-6-1-13]|uniref:CRISPR-associated helicase Cas3 n=1 Tax=Chitinophaga fulva TaxID=2728842 RepID=A0A848GT49_9BACT|nr:CRISPR-associated helicase Cas3' [Chitinophaga fulva]NML38968.1 CRISPR-associated helicase Cas3' [Chitinophaga fulva]
MKDKVHWRKIQAKSKEYGDVKLYLHLKHVTWALDVMCRQFQHQFCHKLARKGGVLHDLGKAHPHFRRKLQKKRSLTAVEEVDWGYTHRHELSSLAFLPAFPREEWDVLIDMVVAHHRSVVYDPRRQGILDLDNNDRHWIPQHLHDWEEWREYGRSILRYFKYDCPVISRGEAEAALHYVVEYCARKPVGWSRWRGLLKAADHFASAYTFNTQRRLDRLFKKPDQTLVNSRQGNDLYPLSKQPVDDRRPHTIVSYPTSSGKTEFLIRRCVGRIFYMLPYQASCNAMQERLEELLQTVVDLQHGTSELIIDKKKEQEKEERLAPSLAGAAVKVMTPHQVAAIVFGIAGFESMMLDLEGCDVILDEIHTYEEFSQAMVLEIVKTLVRLNCRIHIGTATMPRCLYDAILEILGGTENVYEVVAPAEVLDSYNRHTIHRLQDDRTVPGILQKAIDDGEKCLLVFNTVDAAQKAYEIYEQIFKDIPVLLIHRQFSWMFRHKAEQKLEKLDKAEGPCIVIATQVVEVSLDISFDLLVTACAPLECLIQRMGRIHRRRSVDSGKIRKPVYVLAPAGDCRPYDKETVEKSYQLLPDGDLEERDLQCKLDTLYPSLHLREIDDHLIFRNGRYVIRELTDTRNPILSMMMIDSLTCILKEDELRYKKAGWKQRRKMEIPISRWLVKTNKLASTQLEVGSKPFVVMQSKASHAKKGLMLNDEKP